MTLMRNNGICVALLFSLCGQAQADSLPSLCWGEPLEGGRIDIGGNGAVQGAWVLSESLLPARLQQAGGPLNLLVAGYDVISARRICEQLTKVENTQARLVFGGRERYLAQQGVPAWEWLVRPANALAANLVMGDMSGIFVGDGKAVVGKGLEKTQLTDPADIAAQLLERFQARKQPVVLFVSAQLQQPFLAFYANNPLPGVFLSFESAEVVRDALNKYANFNTQEQADLLNYYCN